MSKWSLIFSGALAGFAAGVTKELEQHIEQLGDGESIAGEEDTNEEQVSDRKEPESIGSVLKETGRSSFWHGAVQLFQNLADEAERQRDRKI